MRISRACGIVTCSAMAIFAAATPVAAQGSTGVPAVDSAAAARSAWARAADALQHGNRTEARREMDRAAAAWPTQPAYVWTDAILAARAGDAAAALDALRRYAALGLGRDLRGDTALSTVLDLPAPSADVAAIVAAHDANRAAVARSQVRATWDDSTFWPEGMDVDPRTHRLYVASVRHRTIAVVDPLPSRRSRDLWPRDRADLGAILGVRVDTIRGVLWATTSGIPQTAGYVAADSAIGALLRIRLSDGAIERRWNLPPVPGGHVLGDLAVGPAGDVFVTDSNEPVVYWLRPAADTLESLRHPLFRSLQGLAPTPDGRVLYLADYSHGLLRVDLATRAVTRLDDAPRSTSLGCDGIAWSRGAIIAVQNGVAPARIMRFVLDPTGTRITRAEVLDQNAAVADEPTIGAVTGGEFVYVANSQWDKHDAAGRRIGGAALSSPVILAVPLPREK